jgi:hypothetical protein
MMRRFKNDQEVDDLDIKISFQFSIRKVVHNSGLNADILKALSIKDHRAILHALLADYELNYRQFAIYIIDCDSIGCPQGLI